MTNIFYIVMALVAGALLASVTIYQMSKPRRGVWKCRKCRVKFTGGEGGACPVCKAEAPHRWLGRVEQPGKWLGP